MPAKEQFLNAYNWLRPQLRKPVVRTGIYAFFWCLLWLDAHAWYRLGTGTQLLGFLTAIPVCWYWIRRWRGGPVLIYRAVLSACYLPLWQLLGHLPLYFYAYSLADTITSLGTIGAFFLGLSWAVWWIDRETKRVPPADEKRRVWDPRYLVAWYFGRRSRKLRQSLFTLLT